MADSYPTTDRSFALRAQSCERASGPVTRALAALRAEHPEEPATRRGFLRALTALPMIGGGVALIGSPTGVAAPASRDLLARYSEWLRIERDILHREMFPGVDPAVARVMSEGGAHASVVQFFVPDGFRSWRDAPQPSTRAALVLSAVGCDWR